MGYLSALNCADQNVLKFHQCFHVNSNPEMDCFITLTGLMDDELINPLRLVIETHHVQKQNYSHAT